MNLKINAVFYCILTISYLILLMFECNFFFSLLTCMCVCAHVYIYIYIYTIVFTNDLVVLPVFSNMQHTGYKSSGTSQTYRRPLNAYLLMSSGAPFTNKEIKGQRECMKPLLSKYLSELLGIGIMSIYTQKINS